MAKLDIQKIEKLLFTTEIRIHVGYINQGHHLGHESLVLILQEVRERYFNSLDTSEFAHDDYGIMIVNVAVEFLKEGHYGDTLTIKLGIGKIGSTSVEFIYEVYNQHEQQVARALTTSVFCSKSKRKVMRIPHDIAMAFK